MLVYNLLDVSLNLDGDDMIGLLIAVLGALVILIIAFGYIQNKDNNKPLLSKECKIVDKVSSGGQDRYTVEFDSGERIILVNYNTADTKNILLTVGDIGVVEYRGETIKGFKRINQFNVKKEDKLEEKPIINNGEWQCMSCGKIHQNYVGTCGCGERKPQ